MPEVRMAHERLSGEPEGAGGQSGRKARGGMGDPGERASGQCLQGLHGGQTDGDVPSVRHERGHSGLSAGGAGSAVPGL